MATLLDIGLDRESYMASFVAGPALARDAEEDFGRSIEYWKEV